jgi:hypothetical protein
MLTKVNGVWGSGQFLGNQMKSLSGAFDLQMTEIW